MLIADIRSFWVCSDKKFTDGTFRKVALKSTKSEFCDNVEFFRTPFSIQFGGLCTISCFKETENPWFLRLYTLMKIRTYCHVIGYRKTQAAVAGSLSSLATKGAIWRANLFLRMWKKERMQNAASTKELSSLHGLVNNRHKICMHGEGFETKRDRK